LRQVKQRVSRWLRLDPLGPAEVEQYVEHRLAVARQGHPSRLPGARTLEREIAAWDGPKPFTRDAVAAVARLSGGIPRTINLLCDRALEAACARQMRNVDSGLIEEAAQALALRPRLLDPDAAPLSAGGSEPRELRDESPPIAFGRFEPASTRSRAVRAAAAAAAVAAVGAAVWFGAQFLDPPAEGPPAAGTPAVEPALLPPPVAPEPSLDRVAAAPAGGAPEGAAAPGAPARADVAQERTGTTAASDAGALAAPVSDSGGGEAFEIVVASFRTASRASAVAAELEALGQSTRRRVADGWQQVLAGPFPSSTAAQAAQKRLDGAGFTGTQIVEVRR
jgi:general secretion pathway protein A